MLVLDLVIIALIALGAYSGHKKGLVTIFVGFAALILSIVLAFAFQSVVADALYNFGLGNSIETTIEENIQKMIDNGENVDDSFYGKIVSNVTSQDQVATAAQTVTRFIIKGLSFIAIFVVVKLICYILQMVLNLVFNLPILNAINGTGGTVVGALSIVIKICILLAILSFIAPLPAFAPVMTYIDKTILTKFLYNHNFVVAIIKAGLNI